MSFKAQFSTAAVAFAAPAVSGQPQSVWDVALPHVPRCDSKSSGKTANAAAPAWEGRIRLAAAGAAEKLSAAAELERERLRLTAEGITDFIAVGDYAVFLFNGSLWRSRLQGRDAKRLAEAIAADAELVVDKACVQPSLRRLLTKGSASPVTSMVAAGPLLTPRVSPDGRWVAFAVDGAGGKTAYVAALPTPGTKLPVGGVTDIFPVLPGVKHALGMPADGGADDADSIACPAGLSVGTADYLAQEEFGRMEGLWWAPDSSKLLLQCTQEEPLPAASPRSAFGAITASGGSPTATVEDDGSIVELPHPKPSARAALQRDMEREYGLSSTAERWADEDADAAIAVAGSSPATGAGSGAAAGGDDEGAPERFRYYFAGGRNPRVFFAVVPQLDALRAAVAAAAAAAAASGASAAGSDSSGSSAPADAVAAAFTASTAATRLLWPSGASPTVDAAGAASSAAGAPLSSALLPLPVPGGADDLYVPRAHWLADSSAVVLQVLNRTQDCTELYAYGVTTAAVPVASAGAEGRQLLLRERAGAGGWLNVHDCCTMLPSLDPADTDTGAAADAAGAHGSVAEHGRDRFLLWASERSGFRHLYLYGWGPSFSGLRPAAADAARAARTAVAAGHDADTGEGEAVCLRAITSGPWPVELVLDVLVLPQLPGARRGKGDGQAAAVAESVSAAAAGHDASIDAGAGAGAAIAAALRRASSSSAGVAAAAAADALRRTAVIFQAAGQTPCESHVYAAPLLSWQPLAPQQLLPEAPSAPLVAQLLQDIAPADGAELPPPRYSSAGSSLWWFERETSSEAVAARVLAARELAAYAEHVRYCRHGIVRLTAGAGTHRSAVSADGRWLVDELSTAYAESPSLTLFSLNAPALAVALGMAPTGAASAKAADVEAAAATSAEAAAGGAGASAAAGQPKADAAAYRRVPRGLRGSALLPCTPAYAAARLLLAGPTLPGDEPPLPSACQTPKAPSSPLAAAASAASAACSCGGTGSSKTKAAASKPSSSSSASAGGCAGCCTGESRGRSSSSSTATPSAGGPPAGRASWSPAARRSAAKKESRCCGPSVGSSSSGGGGGDFFSSFFGSASAAPSVDASSGSSKSATAAADAAAAAAAGAAEDLGPGGFKHVEGALWGTVLTRSGRAARSAAWPRDRMAASVLPFEASGPYASAGACAYAATYPLRPAMRPAAGSAAAADSALAGSSASSSESLRRARRDAASGGFVTPVGVITGLLPHPYAATMAYLHDAHRLMGEGSEWLPASLAEDDGVKASALGVPLAELLRPDESGEYDGDDDSDDDDHNDGVDEDVHDNVTAASAGAKDAGGADAGGVGRKEHGRRKGKKHRHDDGDDGDDVMPDGSILDTLSRLSSRFLTAIGQASAVVGAAMGDDDDDGAAGGSGHGKRKRHHRAKTVPVEPPAAALAPAGAVAGAFTMRPNLLLALAFPAGLASFEALAGDAKAAPVGRRRAVFHPRSCYNDDPLRQDAPPKPQRPAVLALRTAPALTADDGSTSSLVVSSGPGPAADSWPVSLHCIASNDAPSVMFGAVTLPVLRRMREAMLRAREAADTPAAAVFASCFGVDAGTWPAFGQPVTEASTPCSSGSVETTWMAAPTILYVYGGPGVRLISNDCNLRRGGRSCAGAFAKEGFVTVMIDGRGSTGRGAAFERAIRMRMGGPEADDQVAGLRQLAAGGIVHPGHVGVHGWSYGGYMTLRLMSQGKEQPAAAAATPTSSTGAGAAGGAGAASPAAAAAADSVPVKTPSVFQQQPKPQLLLPFRAGVSGAPVTDWRFYDTAYTERYLGLPSAEAGLGFAAAAAPAGAAGSPASAGAAAGVDEAYDASSVLRGPQRLLNLAGRHLLMLHGTKDENVLPQNTEAVATALPTLFGVALMQRQGVGATAQNFRLRWLPGQRHALRGPASTRRDNMTVRFLADHVLGVVTHKEAAADDD